MLQPKESPLRERERPDPTGVHLRVEPERASVEVAHGKFAAIRVRLSVEGTPRPIKGHPSVRVVDDPAFELAGVTETRRFERTIEFEVHGRFRDTHARDVKLAYEVDGLRVDQIVAFVPAVPNVPPYVAQTPATVPATPTAVTAPGVEGVPARIERPRDPLRHETMEVAPAPMRLLAAAIDFVAAALLTGASGFAFIVVAAISIAIPCGTEDYPAGSNCLRAEDAYATVVAAWWLFIGIPVYHVVTCIVGRSLGKRWLGLRVVRIAPHDHPREASSTPVRAPGFWRGVMRSFVGYAGIMCAGTGYLWMFFNRDRRGWHDLASGTVVVRAAPSTRGAEVRFTPPAEIKPAAQA